MFDSASNLGTTFDRTPITRQRLLDAAAEVFSEKGFREATIRDISSRAGANVAAVNYHFGDKEGLYREVLRYADLCAAAMKHVQVGVESAGGMDPRVKLKLFVRGYLAALVDSGKLAWHNRLIARELMEPSPALDIIVNENIRPRSEMLSGIIRELLGAGGRVVPEELVLRCKFSVTGQCLIYHSGRHVVERLNPECSLNAGNSDAVADHIVAFSLAAIDGLRAGLSDGAATESSA